MKEYLPRIADKLLEERLDAKGAVLIEGPKWCGKTTTAKQKAKSFISMDRPDMTRQYQQMAEISPNTLLKGETPRLIDEWQISPNLWNAVRYEVDNRDEFGQFILTGSAVPNGFDDSMHTGTGRISKLLMRTMSLFESKDSSGEVSIKDLFKGENISAINETSLEKIAFFICRGGWPKAIGLDEKPALFQAIDYFDAIVSTDISRVDFIKRDKERTKRLLKSYARHVGTQSSLETIRQDMLANQSDTFDQGTLYSYLDALRKIFVIEDSAAWNPNLRSKTSIRTTETRYFSDPSIATASLGMGPNDLLNDLNTMGFLFENLCVRDLRIYTDYLDGTVYHYRDKSGLECDAVIHLRNGAYGLIEIKLGGDKLIEEGAKTLKDLASKIDTKNMFKPSFMMVLCAKAPFAYKRNDDVYVIPITALRP
ncbi:AAA family ATPase [Veillonellaceae bacterium M2-8]|nr:AAA family ATPase [Veillonellaceae bacterium M2-8]MUP58597.1 AAA family ATPase [Veillonellaceae bacterium M2-4]